MVIKSEAGCWTGDTSNFTTFSSLGIGEESLRMISESLLLLFSGTSSQCWAKNRKNATNNVVCFRVQLPEIATC